MNDIVFNKNWFKKHQGKLLFLLNAPVIKYWFRWCLRIRKNDCLSQEKINQITPNSFSFGGRHINGGRIELKTDFRTHDKYAKRLYFAFKPIWYLVHFLDWAMLDRVEALTHFSFGFSTLTAYPDGNPESSTVDGYVARSGVDETFGTIRGGNGTSFDDDASSNNPALAYLLSNGTSNHFSIMRRGIFLFDTSGLTASATISSTVLSFYWSAGADQFTGHSIGIVSGVPASNTGLANADFQNAFGTTRYATDVTHASFNASGYTDFTFNGTGNGNVSKTGITKIGTRSAWDIDNSSPTWGASQISYIECMPAETSGTSQDPKMVVTYSLPSSNTNFQLFF